MKPEPMRWVVLVAVLLVLIITTTSAYIRLSPAGLGFTEWPARYTGISNAVAFAYRAVNFADGRFEITIWELP